MKNFQLTRRHYLTATGAVLASALARGANAQKMAVIRQGFQTNMWGMPTYYLMRSGLLEKRGIKFEEFAVPSGNLTMQQMVARQVDLGTYAGPSLLIGHARGGMAGVAVIEHVGKSIRIMGRKDLNLKKVEDLRGKKVANQTGSSVGNIFVDQIAPKAGLKKGDFQEVRMNVNDMVAAMAAKTVDVMISTEPYNQIAEDEGIATTIVNYFDVDKLPVFMAATPEFIEKEPATLTAYLKTWLEVTDDFKKSPDKVAKVIHDFYTSKGYTMSLPTLTKALGTVEVNPEFPSDLGAYMEAHAKVLIAEKKIPAMPDWKKVIRPEFLEKARAMG